MRDAGASGQLSGHVRSEPPSPQQELDNAGEKSKSLPAPSGNFSRGTWGGLEHREIFQVLVAECCERPFSSPDGSGFETGGSENFDSMPGAGLARKKWVRGPEKN